MYWKKRNRLVVDTAVLIAKSEQPPAVYIERGAVNKFGGRADKGNFVLQTEIHLMHP